MNGAPIFQVQAKKLFHLSLGTGFVCFAISAAAAVSTNSDWSLQTWESNNGLPNNNVSSLVQSSDGYLWVATSGNFARFDGVRFEEFAAKSFLTNYGGYNERGGVLLDDSKDNLWLALVRGPLIRLNSGVAQIFTNNLPDYVVLNIVEDNDGAIWITYHGNVVVRVKDGEVKRFGAQDGLPEKFDCALTRDNQGRLWFAKDGQAGIFRDNHFVTLVKTLGRNVRLAAARAGGIWICSGRDLFKCDDSGALKPVGMIQEISPADPTALLEDKSGAVWIGTSASGLFRYNGSGFEKIPTSHPSISCLLQDREGNIWAGTGGGGLDEIRPRAFALEDETTGLPFGTVESICEDTRGAIWAATQNGLLACKTNGSWRNISGQTNWPGGRATCVAADSNGSIWIGTRNHFLLQLQDGRFKTLRAENGFVGHVVRGLISETNGNLWAVEEDPDVVQCLHDGQWQTFNLPTNSGVPRASCEDAEKNIWIGTSRGFLLRIHDNTLTDETTFKAGIASSIRSLAATSDGSLWIGYATVGLGRLKDGQLAKITAAQGLFNEDISEIVADNHGWIWFGSDRGIFKVRQRELNDVAEGRASRVLSINYGEGNNLPSLQASFGMSPNVLHSSDDRLWFPASTALAVVNLNNLQEDLHPPPVLLKQVVVDDKTIAAYGGAMPVAAAINLSGAKTKLQLPPNHRHVEFYFTALCFSAPENVHFQYRLANLDEDWVDAGTQRSISYSRLSAGNYRFEVRARNGDSPWSEASAVSLNVRPFFWNTWWFRLFALLIFTASVIAIVRYVSFQRLQKKLRSLEEQAALDKERSRIAKDIHDDLGGSLTQIKLLFELAKRKNTEPDKIDLLGREGLATTREVIKSMDEIVWAINPRNDSLPHLVDYLGQFAIEFLARADIRCRVDLPDRPVAWNISPEARHNLFLAVKEALNNVIRHSGANEVWLRVTATEKILTITIEDNGHGFERTTTNEFADGLLNMNRRMSEIGGRSNIESKAGIGTHVSLIFPKPNGK